MKGVFLILSRPMDSIVCCSRPCMRSTTSTWVWVKYVFRAHEKSTTRISRAWVSDQCAKAIAGVAPDVLCCTAPYRNVAEAAATLAEVSEGLVPRSVDDKEAYASRMGKDYEGGLRGACVARRKCARSQPSE